MRMADVREFRAHLTHYVSGEEPVLLTRPPIEHAITDATTIDNLRGSNNE
jgi:hypothetical protein